MSFSNKMHALVFALLFGLASSFPLDGSSQEKLNSSKDKTTQDALNELNRKTSGLLTEAMHMMDRIKSQKERFWLESFIQRLADLTSPVVKPTEKLPSSTQPSTTFIPVTTSTLSEQDLTREFLLRQVLNKVQELKDLGVSEHKVIDLLKRSNFEDEKPKEDIEDEVQQELEKPSSKEQSNFSDLSDDLVQQLRKEKFVAVSSLSPDTQSYVAADQPKE